MNLQKHELKLHPFEEECEELRFMLTWWMTRTNRDVSQSHVHEIHGMAFHRVRPFSGSKQA